MTGVLPRWMRTGSGTGITVSGGGVCAVARPGTATASAAATMNESENLCMGGSLLDLRAVGDHSVVEVVRAQRALAAARPPQWRGEARGAAIGAVAICFPRGVSGPGAAGDPAWAAAVVM